MDSRLKLDEEERKAFITAPLASILLDKFVTFQSRTEMKKEPVSDQLPFDVGRHPQAGSAVALSMIERLHNDMKIYADQQNHGKVAKCLQLLDEDVQAYVSKKDPQTNEALQRVIQHLEDLIKLLLTIRDADSDYVANAIPFVTKQANHVPLPDVLPSPSVSDKETDKDKGKEKEKDQAEPSASSSSAPTPKDDVAERYRYVLKRYCGQETFICTLT